MGKARSATQPNKLLKRECADCGLTIVNTAHLVARTCFYVFSCPARARLSSLNHAWTRGSSLHQSLCTGDVWSGLPHPSQPPQTTCSTKLERASLTEIKYRLSAAWLSGRLNPSHKSEVFASTSSRVFVSTVTREVV